MSELERVEHDGPVVSPNSLEARVAERRKAIEARTTQLFDVPGYEGILKVELQVVGGKRQYAILTRHENIRDEYRQRLMGAAGLVLAATVAFHSVLDDEGNTALAEECSWKRLAKAADPTLLDSVVDGPGGGSVALLRLLGEEGTIALAGDWKLWQRSRGQQVSKELADF